MCRVMPQVASQLQEVHTGVQQVARDATHVAEDVAHVAQEVTDIKICAQGSNARLSCVEDSLLEVKSDMHL